MLVYFYRKSVLVIDGKNNNDDGEWENHKIGRRSEQYVENKSQKENHMLRVRSLNSRSIKKLTVLIV
jgi:hypothetical protein